MHHGHGFDVVAAEDLVAMTAATTPEEAYKLFIAKLTPGVAQAMANALAAAVGTALKTVEKNKSIDGWQKFVTGFEMHLDYGVPFDADRFAAFQAAAKAGAKDTVPAGYFETILQTSLRGSVQGVVADERAKLLGLSITGGFSYTM